MVISRKTLVQQVLVALQADICAGKWDCVLPAEQAICEHYQVSRTTVREALRQLRRQGMVETVNGVGTRVLQVGAPVNRPDVRTIGLLEPAPISELKPYQVLWIDDLKSLLFKAGYELIIHIGKHYLRANNSRALQRLVSQHSHSCWVLNLSNRPIQQWFSEQRIPCVVAGTCYDSVTLPSVALDNYALGRHAAGRLLSAGHRRLALLVERDATPAWAKCVAGFTEVCKTRAGEVELAILQHEPVVETVVQLLGRVFRKGKAPTAMMVINPFYYLTVAGFLAERKLSVPADVSLITTYGDPFLNFVMPRPCRYDYRPRHYARFIQRMILGIARGTPSPVSEVQRLMPDYIPGASLSKRTTHTLGS